MIIRAISCLDAQQTPQDQLVHQCPPARADAAIRAHMQHEWMNGCVREAPVHGQWPTLLMTKRMFLLFFTVTRKIPGTGFIPSFCTALRLFFSLLPRRRERSVDVALAAQHAH